MKICTCMDCGDDYPYDHSRPMGASSSRCCPCRKRNTKKLKVEALMKISSPAIQCRKCGYSASILSLSLVDGVESLHKKMPDEQKALNQFILCNNCLGEHRDRKFEFRVISTKTPLDVRFYERQVRVIEKPIESKITYDHAAETVEVVGKETDRIIGAAKGAGSARKELPNVIDIP